MSDYSEYRVTQARMERARDRQLRQKRSLFVAGAVLAVIVIVFGLASSIRRSPAAVATPATTLTWPSSNKYGKRTFRMGREDGEPVQLGEVLARPNQPFTVTLANPAMWEATTVTAAGTSPGVVAKWRAGKDENFKLFLRPVVSGWRKLFAWMEPKTEYRLTARQAQPLDANRRALTLQEAGNTIRAVWLSSNVVASAEGGSATLVWDERAIPLLETAGRIIPYGGPKPGPGRSMPLPPPRAARWSLVDSFGSKRAAGDKGSYFTLNGAEALSEDAPIIMTRLARQIAARAPKASIKWIVADAGSSDARVTLRLEFDNSAARGGWVKRTGEAAAAPLRWWNATLGESDIRSRLAPSLPR